MKKENKKMDKKLIIGIILIVLVIASLSGYYILNKNKRFSRGMFQINEEDKQEVSAFFENNPTNEEINEYCNNNRQNCFYYCRNINQENLYCIELVNNRELTDNFENRPSRGEPIQ
ncbi:MAG: hypothetical protein WC867_05715 [Candidatus Pacearchaeota archaeon]|jgi:flagellar basal body-associated protein FliL